MAGQIIKRGKDRWLVRVPIGRDEATKVRRYYSKMIHGTKRDAEAHLAEKLHARDTGLPITPSRETLGGYLDRWLKDAARGRLRARTFDSYTTILRLYVRLSLGGRRLGQITPLELQGLYTDLQARGLSAKTVRHAHTTLHVALEDAVRWHLLPRNPADGARPPKVARREMRPLAPEEVERFRLQAAKDTYRLIFDLLLATGARPSEALAWQWQDWSKPAATLTVQRVLNPRGEEATFAEPKTARSRRTIPLPASANKALLEHFVAAADKAPTALIFPSPKGGPLDERALVRRHFKPILKAAGLPMAVRLYDLRHTHATALLVAGENPKVVSERLGHASITLTLDTYSHVLPTMQQAAAAKVEALLFGGRAVNSGGVSVEGA